MSEHTLHQNPNKLFMQNIFNEKPSDTMVKEQLKAANATYWVAKRCSNTSLAVASDTFELWVSSPLPITNEEAVMILEALSASMKAYGEKMSKSEWNALMLAVTYISEVLTC